MKKIDIANYFEGIKNKDITILAKAISLVESRNPEHFKLSSELLKKIIPLTGNARRIGISGTPGVGKSTFLENFGMYLVEKKKSIAILAIDPTSQISGGSILGDKTRMTQLSAQKDVFIRPSPNGKTLGGVAAKTREAMLLCDAYGFDYIFVETVGVGQSEISVSHIVDMFILLMQPGGGDELQGIKRGILEVSDLVLVNKSDGDYEKISKLAQHDYKSSLDILQAKKKWNACVLRCSALSGFGFDDINQNIDKYFNEFDLKDRQEQVREWFFELLKEKYLQKLSNYEQLDEVIDLVQKGESDIISSVEIVFNEVFKK